MEKKTLFKLISFAGFALGVIAPLLSGWAAEQEQDALIGEKIDEALANRTNEEES